MRTRLAAAPIVLTYRRSEAELDGAAAMRTVTTRPDENLPVVGAFGAADHGVDDAASRSAT